MSVLAGALLSTKLATGGSRISSSDLGARTSASIISRRRPSALLPLSRPISSRVVFVPTGSPVISMVSVYTLITTPHFEEQQFSIRKMSFAVNLPNGKELRTTPTVSYI